MEDSHRYGRKHTQDIVQTLDRAEETNKIPRKFAKEEKLFIRISDANWNPAEILITCEMSIGTAVTRVAEVILKNMPAFLYQL